MVTPWPEVLATNVASSPSGRAVVRRSVQPLVREHVWCHLRRGAPGLGLHPPAAGRPPPCNRCTSSPIHKGREAAAEGRLGPAATRVYQIAAASSYGDNC